MKSRISECDWKCFEDRVQGGISLKTLANRNGVSVETIRRRLSRCVRRLLRAEQKWLAAEQRLEEMRRQLNDLSGRLHRTPPTSIARDALVVDTLSLSVRAFNGIMNIDTRLTVAALGAMTRKDLDKTKNIGTRTIDEIAEKVDRLGIPHQLWENR